MSRYRESLHEPALADVESLRGWRLTDLIDVRTLQSIQDTFARAFRLPTVIVHPDGTNATDITHRVTFCEDLTRTSVVGGPRCAECDLSAIRRAAGSDQPAIFKCWNGLYDCAIPIASRGLTLGYFLCGQIMVDAPDLEDYRETAAELGLNPHSYVEALGDVRQVDFARYEASVQSMHVLAGMIAEQATAAIENLAMLEDAEVARADAGRLLGELDAILEGLREVGSQPDYQSTLQATARVLDQLIPWDSCVIYLVDEARDVLRPVVVRDPYPAAVAEFQPRLGQSIVGAVAMSGVGRRVDDVTQDEDFEPIPNVPAEPEAMLAVPMVYRDAVSGVIVLSRFERRVFTDHELRVLSAFSSQASVSIQLAKLASDNAQRLREEQALTALLRTISSSTGGEAILSTAARVAAELFDAEVLIEASTAAAGPAMRVTHGLSESAASGLREALEADADAASEHDAVRLLEWHDRSVAIIPIVSARDAQGVVILLAESAHEWDERLMRALASQLALGLEKVRLHDRELAQLREYRQLSELGTELAHAPAVPDLERRLLSRVRGMFSADAAWLALLAGGPDAIEVVMLDGPEVRRQTIRLEGPGRVAALRLRDEQGCGRSVFDSWAHEVERIVHGEGEIRSSIAEILSVSTGALGGVFVGWRQAVPAPAVDEVQTLGLVASAAGASLARLAAHEQTDASLRDRVSDLEAMTQLAQRLTGLRDQQSIFDEILLAFRRLGRLDGSAYMLPSEDHSPKLYAASGLSAERSAALLDAYGRRPEGAGPIRVALASEERDAIFLTVAFGARQLCLVGIGPREHDPHRDRALQMIVRHGSVALENAELGHRQQRAITRLEYRNREVSEQTEKLERVLSVHETLASAVLQGRGLASVAASLSAFIDGELIMIGSDETRLASSPADAEIGWRPLAAPATATQESVLEDGTHVLAAPAVVEGDQLAWVVARLAKPPDDVDRAAVEYGALLTALELLRERTASEVEARLRGGLLEDLFAGEFVDELISRQALALGVDLRGVSRVYLIEAIERPVSATGTPVDPKLLLGAISALVRSLPGSLVSLRGRAVAAVVPEPDSREEQRTRFEERLRKLLDERFPELACVIAVGTECTVPADYRGSFQAARRGLDLLRLQQRHDGTFSFREATMATVMLRSSEPAVIIEFIARYVDPLDNYDAEHSSELRHTAEAYFATGGNLERTARQLHVHVSTLRYRLGRIAELLGISLKDRSALLDLQVALEVAQPMAVHRGAAAGSAHRQQAGPDDG